ncbi:hypothetical protein CHINAEXTREME_14985 [Halobiforma lacisalsi AJ5]|uniref:Uncharacterized protein n=1 Tax=Natronobacterium lacisalsi AJ5 TaxID=358396 RepID=M0LCM7_NATLA|nr:hypothetical protein [Halobiforma lacisalsi]APW98999.1 hypothetical protein CHINAEXTREME_14985 [Halobiforma lacisalsi AJ5]EMA30179.1 hypothetical protein C445_16589 [Halobiforma lacisalsi AJ5]
MTDGSEKRRAAARCDRCGTIGLVRIWENGRIEPVSGRGICDCADPALRILEGEEVDDLEDEP